MIQFGACHLHGLDAQATEKSRAAESEGRTEEEKPPRLGTLLHRGVELLVELEGPESVIDGDGPPRKGHDARVRVDYFLCVDALEFGAVGARLGGGIDEVEGPGQVSSVRGAYLGDDKGVIWAVGPAGDGKRVVHGDSIKCLAQLTSIGYHEILNATNILKERYMKALYCDVCKKLIEDPEPTRNYFHIADIDVCEPCKDDLDAAMKATIRGKSPFSYEWNDELTMKILHDGMQKGRIDIKGKR
jgi:hypothetical protein